MRILVYAGGFAPVGGIESFIHALATSLVDRETQVTVLCWGKRSPLLDAIGRQNVTIRRVPVQRGCRYAIPDLLLAVVHGVREILRQDVTVLTKLPPEPLQSFLDWVARRSARRRFIYVTPYRPSEMWSEKPPSRHVLNSLDTIIVQANDFAEDLRRFHYRGTVEIIPYIPPATSRTASLPAGRGIRVGFLGRLVPQKNVAHLLKAFSLIGTEQPADRSWELHIFGDGVERARLQDMAGHLGIAQRVCFHGMVRGGQVAEAIDQCHLFAFPSVSEGQCLAALEILARGRPIVATPVGAFPEILSNPEFGAIGPLHDVEGFARVLSRIGTAVVQEHLTPHAIQTSFGRVFSRPQVIDRYRAVIVAQHAHAPSPRLRAPVRQA